MTTGRGRSRSGLRRWSTSMTTWRPARRGPKAICFSGFGAKVQCGLAVGSAGSMIGARNASNLGVRMHSNKAGHYRVIRTALPLQDR